MPSGRPRRPSACEQRPLEVLAEGRLPGDAARLLEPDRRRDDRLVRAALGRERHARRRADEDRLAAGVHAERPRLERAVDERVVDRRRSAAAAGPSRDHVAPSSPSRPTRLPSAMPELDVLAVRRTRASARACPCRRRTSRCGRPCSRRPTRLIQPPRFVEEATSGLTVTTRSATSGAACARSTKKRPNACCVEAVPACARPTSRGTARRRARGERLALAAARPRSGTARPRRVPSAKRAHGSSASAPRSPASCAHCSAVSSAEWLAGWPSVGSRQRLDRVGEDRPTAGRVAASACAERVEQVGEVVTAEVARRPRASSASSRSAIRRSIVAAPAARRRAAARAARRRRCAAGAGTPRCSSRRCASRSASPPSRSNSSRSRRPYLTVIVCQPAASNIAPIRPAAMSGTTRSSDWRLRSTIHSTSPRRGDHRIDERLPDRALVELGVAEQRDVAAALRHVEVAGDVAVRERAPDRRRRADADRAGREVDRVGVLACGSGSSAARRTRAASSGTRGRACRAGS